MSNQQNPKQEKPKTPTQESVQPKRMPAMDSSISLVIGKVDRNVNTVRNNHEPLPADTKGNGSNK